ncbi:MAG: PEP-CTERM sorting domain-containing protein [Verrucomicrobia bacterium]|nr:PEP-CTERM sorting domain-containing protein [Verrucomicrobiota bacterium]MCH8527044.1 PEP-CTERM sorting domain-containing protein [Kiritimatiellia bacterium]
MKILIKSTLFSAMTLPMLVFGQLFWNPNVDEYDTVGGNGNWNDAGVWWDGTSNVTAGTDPGQEVIYEGSGSVGGSTFQPQRLEFQNLTGDYNINHGLELRLSGSHAVHVKDGNFDVYIQSLGMQAGTGANRSVRNDGTGTVTVNSTLRRFGGGTTNLTFLGDGDFQINGAGAMGGELIKNDSGHLTVNGNMNSFSNGIVLNGGSLWMDNSATSFLWNSGEIHADLDESGFSSNTIDLSGDFTRGAGSDFTFDFRGFNATQEATYLLMNFADTTFANSDFSAANITYDSGLSGQFNVTGTSLEFSVIPEPGTLALIGFAGLLGWMRLRRRR